MEIASSRFWQGLQMVSEGMNACLQTTCLGYCLQRGYWYADKLVSFCQHIFTSVPGVLNTRSDVRGRLSWLSQSHRVLTFSRRLCDEAF